MRKIADQFEFRSSGTLLWLLFAILLLLAIQSVVCTYFEVTWFPPLLSDRAAPQLAFGAFALAVARDQFALGLRPILSYSSGDGDAATDKSGADETRWWKVTIRNDGTGVGIIESVSYRLRLTEAAYGTYDLLHEDVLAKLREYDLKESDHYDLPLFSNGHAIGTGDERPLFMIRMDHLNQASSSLGSTSNEKLVGLDVEITFRGILGDLYKREISCIPKDRHRMLTH